MGRLGLKYSQICFARQNREYKPPKIQYPCKAFDTETEKGDIRIIADEGSFIETPDFDAILNFLTRYECHEKINWFYNLRFDMGAMFKPNRRLCEELFTRNQAVYNRMLFQYIPNKSLTITSHGNKFRYFDLAQFYASSLKYASKKYLNKETHEFKEDRDRLFELYTPAQIGEYCKNDAQLTKELGDIFLNSLTSFSIRTNKPFSTAYISQDYALKNFDIPTLYDSPKGANRLGYDAYRGGWFECYKKGFFQNVYAYDIISAYPSIMRTLPDIRDGEWDNTFNPKEYMGFTFAEIKQKSKILDCMPVSIQCKGTNIYPQFDEWHPAFLTYQEVRSFKDFYNIKPIRSMTFYPNDGCRMPYKDFVDTLYPMKAAYSKDDFRRQIVKIILNSLYGKMAQLIPSEGKFKTSVLTNFIYASYITAGTRCKIFDTIKENNLWGKVIQILTDALVIEGESGIKPSKELGGWEEKISNADCLSISCGVYSFKKPDSVTTATRGFSAKNDLWALFATQNKKVIVHTLRPQGVKECLKQDRYADICAFVNQAKELSPDTDIKRLWPPIDHAENFLNQKYESIPWQISDLAMLMKHDDI